MLPGAVGRDEQGWPRGRRFAPIRCHQCRIDATANAGGRGPSPRSPRLRSAPCRRRRTDIALPSAKAASGMHQVRRRRATGGCRPARRGLNLQVRPDQLASSSVAEITGAGGQMRPRVWGTCSQERRSGAWHEQRQAGTGARRCSRSREAVRATAVTVVGVALGRTRSARRNAGRATSGRGTGRRAHLRGARPLCRRDVDRTSLRTEGASPGRIGLILLGRWKAFAPRGRRMRSVDRRGVAWQRFRGRCLCESSPEPHRLADETTRVPHRSRWRATRPPPTGGDCARPGAGSTAAYFCNIRVASSSMSRFITSGMTSNLADGKLARIA